MTDKENSSAKKLDVFVSNSLSCRGYYLARYEASREENDRPQSQPNKPVWKEISQSKASLYSQNMYDDLEIYVDLVNSYAWDTAIVFIQKYSENSNYANQQTLSSDTLDTGKSGDRVCNIHDLASNFQEWSTEHSTTTVSSWGPAVRRGGCYNDTYTAATRMAYSVTATAWSCFRMILCTL